MALTARRLIDPRAYPLAFLALFFAGSTNGMFMPERIDHHGWQLALLALAISAIADPRRMRGGLTLGIATRAVAGDRARDAHLPGDRAARQVLFWVDDRDERERLRAYALALAGGTALAFLLFASYDNRQRGLRRLVAGVAVRRAARRRACSTASPGFRRPTGNGAWRSRPAPARSSPPSTRLTWPHCLQRLEGVSPEVDRLWLSHVREARPIYRHGWRIATLIVALPVDRRDRLGLLAWRRRGDRELLRRMLAAAAPGIAATLLLLWQTRTGPAAQMMATVGARRARLVSSSRSCGTAGIRSCGCRARSWWCSSGAGAMVPFVLDFIPDNDADPARIGDQPRQPAVQFAVGLCARSRCSPRAWCSPSSILGRG